MRALAVVSLVLVAAAAQVTVAPLFPVRGAIPDFPLASLVMLAIFGGPRTAMAALPLAAMALGFQSGRAPALLVVAYLPLLPLGAWLEAGPMPAPRPLVALVLMVAMGSFVRAVLAISAMANGAGHAFGPMVLEVLLPGMLLDALLAAVCYVPLRIMGREPGSLALQGGTSR